MNNISRFRLTRLAVILSALAVAAGCASDGTKPEKAEKPAATNTTATKTTAAKKTKEKPAAAALPPMVFPPPGKDEGTVVFFRERKFAGGAVSFIVREN